MREEQNTMIGETISHYTILEKVGEGSMGIVYKAKDERLHRFVALKIPSEAILRNQNVQGRFLNEARMAASFLHQNIAVLHDVGEHDGRPFLVMEYVDGISLRDLIRLESPLSIEKFLRLAIQICAGLDAVHEKEVLHRDIKSENILISRKEQVKLADCGLAARFLAKEGLAEKLGIAGTPAYMSPEQIRGEHLDQRSDIFSLGVVLFELITGKLPFDATQPDALKYMITSLEPVPIENHRTDVPHDIAKVILRALEKDRDQRYQHASDMLRDLRKIEIRLLEQRTA